MLYSAWYVQVKVSLGGWRASSLVVHPPPAITEHALSIKKAIDTVDEYLHVHSRH